MLRLILRLLNLILLTSLSSSFENFVESFVVGIDSLNLEEAKTTLHTMELRQEGICSNGNIGSGFFC